MCPCSASGRCTSSPSFRSPSSGVSPTPSPSRSSACSRSTSSSCPRSTRSPSPIRATGSRSPSTSSQRWWSSELAARARRWADDAEQRERGGSPPRRGGNGTAPWGEPRGGARGLAPASARVLRAGARGSSLARCTERRGDAALELEAGDRRVGRLFVPESAEPNRDPPPLLPALASLLAGAAERERLRRRRSRPRRSGGATRSRRRCCGRQPRLALTADGDPSASEGLAKRRHGADERGSGRAPRDDPARGEAARPARGEPARLSLLQAGRHRRRPSCGRSTSSSPGARRGRRIERASVSRSPPSCRPCAWTEVRSSECS